MWRWLGIRVIVGCFISGFSRDGGLLLKVRIIDMRYERILKSPSLVKMIVFWKKWFKACFQAKEREKNATQLLKFIPFYNQFWLHEKNILRSPQSQIFINWFCYFAIFQRPTNSTHQQVLISIKRTSQVYNHQEWKDVCWTMVVLYLCGSMVVQGKWFRPRTREKQLKWAILDKFSIVEGSINMDW